MEIDELLSELKIPFKKSGHEHCRPGWTNIDCPFCSPDWNHWRLGINDRHHYGNCWFCGPHNLHSLLMAHGHVSPGKVYDLLKGLERPFPEEEEKPKGSLKLPKAGELKPAHIEYLKSRGFDVEELKRLWRLQGIGVYHRLQWRILIPIHHEGTIVSWTTRSLLDDGVRYISASPTEEAIPHKELLYGEDYVRSTVIICEGPTDVWRIGPGAVALFGTGCTSSQLLRLSKFQNRMVCFDAGAKEQAEELADRLMVFPGNTNLIELDSGDPGSASRTEIRKLRKLVKG